MGISNKGKILSGQTEKRSKFHEKRREKEEVKKIMHSICSMKCVRESVNACEA